MTEGKKRNRRGRVAKVMRVWTGILGGWEENVHAGDGRVRAGSTYTTIVTVLVGGYGFYRGIAGLLSFLGLFLMRRN